MNFVLLALLLLLAAAASAEAGERHEPFFHQADLLRALHSSSMIRLRIEAAEASDWPPERLDSIGSDLGRDFSLFQGSLSQHDPQAAERLRAALAQGLRPETGDHILQELENAERALLPVDKREAPVVRAAVISSLMLGDDGIADGYEQAVEGEHQAYALAWVTIGYVSSLWSTFSPASGEDAAAREEIDGGFQILQSLFPAPAIPGRFSDPEDVETALHQIVSGLERLTNSDLYPDRNLGRLASLAHQQASAGCEAEHAGANALAAELILSSRGQMNKGLWAPLSILAPELHERLVTHFDVLQVAATGWPENYCADLMNDLAAATSVLGGE